MSSAAPWMSQVARVRRSLEGELPSCSFDDAVVEYLASSLDGDEPLSEDHLVESWSPFLISHSACNDEDEARSVCRALLVRLRSEDGTGSTTASDADMTQASSATLGGERRMEASPTASGGELRVEAAPEETISKELEKWLETLRLTQYAEKARDWCERMGAAHLNEVLDNWEDFAEALKLKTLERKRVEKDVASRSGAPSPPIGGTLAPTPQTRSPPTNTSSGSTAASPPGGSSSCRSSAHRHASGRSTFGPPEDPTRYMMLEEIGEGATAKVHRCQRGDEIYAVKTISLSKLRLQRDFERISDKLHREVSILFSLRHPRIVALYDVIEEPEQALQLVMELVDGGELFDKILENGCFTEPVARYVFLQITEGLRYIHSKDIVHRDLKPENILVDERASRGNLLEVKLSDFGHSKLINDGYSTALTRVGTPQYWAPEVSDPRKAAMGYDQRVDLWSLGVVLYVMLVGAYPFDGVGATVDEQMKKVHLSFRGQATGQELSEPAKDLIKALIRENPKDRLPLDQCLHHPWVAMAGGGIAKVMRCVEATPKTVETEVRIPLPRQPTREEVQQLRGDLRHWETRFCFAAVLKHQEVIVNFSEAVGSSKGSGKSGKGGYVRHGMSIESAQRELQDIISYHLSPPAGPSNNNNVVARPVHEDSNRRRGRFRLLSHTLRVDEIAGAGLDLWPEKGGMRITEVYDEPGQVGLQRNDLITKVNEVPLRGANVEAIFRKHFFDGVLIAVRRDLP